MQSSQGVPEPADNQFVMDVFAREATRNPRDNEELSLGPFPVIQINDIVHASMRPEQKSFLLTKNAAFSAKIALKCIPKITFGKRYELVQLQLQLQLQKALFDTNIQRQSKNMRIT